MLTINNSNAESSSLEKKTKIAENILEIVKEHKISSSLKIKEKLFDDYLISASKFIRFHATKILNMIKCK